MTSVQYIPPLHVLALQSAIAFHIKKQHLSRNPPSHKMDDLDAMLDDAADEGLPTVYDLDNELKAQNKLNGIKPWLAFSSNVPLQKRDEWSRMVKVDAMLHATVSYYCTSEVYLVYVSTHHDPRERCVLGGGLAYPRRCTRPRPCRLAGN